MPSDSVSSSDVGFFCSSAFIDSWVRFIGHPCEAYLVSLPLAAGERNFYAVGERRHKFFNHLFLGPHRLPACPGLDKELEQLSLNRLLSSLKTPSISGFTWHVRFDYETLASGLKTNGIAFDLMQTHVLSLSPDYEKVFDRFYSSTRNKIRASDRRGVVVRDVTNAQDIRDYYGIHLQLAIQRKYDHIFPIELFFEWAKLGDRTRFLVAENEGEIVAGGIFFLDLQSVRYWHGATDRRYKNYPMYAIFNEAISWACEVGATTFDFGGSGGIKSLEQFKEKWSAEPRMNWRFKWKNPRWAPVRRLTRILSKRGFSAN